MMPPRIHGVTPDGSLQAQRAPPRSAISRRGRVTDIVRTFRTRWLDGVTLENRVTYDGQQYQITQIKELGRRRGLDLTVEKVGP
ncbi:hypothetical protein ACVWYH_003331 [Bradyrhizobium sp. GM24.11]